MTRQTAPGGAARQIFARQRNQGNPTSGQVHDRVTVDLEGKSPDELATHAERLRREADDADHLRISKLQRGQGEPLTLGQRDQASQGSRNDAFAIAQMRSSTHDDPACRLARIVSEVAHFTSDREVIVRTAVSWAEDCRIPEDVFAPIIVLAVNRLQQGSHQNAG